MAGIVNQLYNEYPFGGSIGKVDGSGLNTAIGPYGRTHHCFAIERGNDIAVSSSLATFDAQVDIIRCGIGITADACFGSSKTYFPYI